MPNALREVKVTSHDSSVIEEQSWFPFLSGNELHNWRIMNYNVLYKVILCMAVIYQNLSNCKPHITRSPSWYRVLIDQSLDTPVQIQKVLDIMGLDIVGILQVLHILRIGANPT